MWTVGSALVFHRIGVRVLNYSVSVTSFSEDQQKKTAYKRNVKLGSFLDPLLCFDPNQLLHNISVIKT